MDALQTNQSEMTNAVSLAMATDSLSTSTHTGFKIPPGSCRKLIFFYTKYRHMKHIADT